MYILGLAADYDGTLAHHGIVDSETIRALERFQQTGRRLVLVTGRDLPDLKRVFPDLDLFDRVVAENGALLFHPQQEKGRALGPAPPESLIRRLEELRVEPLAVGHCIVATWEPNQKVVLEAIQSLGLDLQIIFNKGAVMILPSGMNKATGLSAALKDLELSFHNVVGVGDAENDHAFLRACGCAAAVANALPAVKETADIVLTKDHGAGVVDLVDRICRDDALILPLDKHGISIGRDRHDNRVVIHPQMGNVLISGSSGVGKSTLATALTEKMSEKGFEFCVFDPEGDYDQLENAVCIGDAKIPPKADEAIALLRKLEANVVVNTQNLHVSDRPSFFSKLLPQIASLRARTARPHWLIIDEAHHLLPAARKDMAQSLPTDLPAAIFVTVHPEAILSDALQTIEIIIAVGDDGSKVISRFCEAVHCAAPRSIPRPRRERDEVLVWFRRSGRDPELVRADRPRQEHKRHTRKYAVGELGENRSFYFRGPDDKLNLRAQNLFIFLQIAQGVDDDTWEYHLRSGDYSHWFRSVIKDDDLADAVAQVENDTALPPSESRKRIGEAVHARYIAPASSDKT